jgi:ABC-type microcin C transport system permease subunit YejB
MGKYIQSGKLLPAAVFMLVCVIAAIPSEAQIAGPCAETITKYCKDVTPGGGRIMKCLNDHRDDQSIPCKDWLEEQYKSLQELNTACTEEIARLCSFDKPDSIRIYKCLDDNYIALKSECREKLREIKDRLQ